MYESRPAQNRKRSKKPLLLLAGVLVLVVAGGSGYALYHHNHQTKTTVRTVSKAGETITYKPSTPADNSSNETRKDSSGSSTLNDGSSSSTTTPASFTATIVNASASSTNVHVGTLVSGTTSGDCTLTASQQGQTSITKTATVQQDVNNYDCGSFNIPTTEFPTSGTWTLTLSVTSNGTSATNSKTVTITKG